MSVVDVPVRPRPVTDYAALLGRERVVALVEAAAGLRRRSGRGTVWNVNSTALGGGVAELLHGLLPLAAGLGIDVRWLVVPGSPAFFEVTKRLCERLYGSAGDGGGLGAAERATYEQLLAEALRGLLDAVRPGDVVVLHDPQTAGLAPRLVDAGCRVVWRCHVGVDMPNQHSVEGWEFLRPYLGAVDVVVFTLVDHAPPWLREQVPVYAVAPSLDPFSPKNRELTPPEVRAVLAGAGVLGDSRGGVADLVQERPIDGDRPLVVQVSRWDRLKDMTGVLAAFGDHVGDGADLLLAGPDVRGVADDPAAADAFAACYAAWLGLPAARRAAVHLGTLSMADPAANALVVNALQRQAAVVVQKSLAEGFGLTVTEAMWKGAPVVASDVGGIRAQVTDGVDGVLVHPRDLAGFGKAVQGLLDDRSTAERIGTRARERVRAQFLVDRHLLDWYRVLSAVGR